MEREEQSNGGTSRRTPPRSPSRAKEPDSPPDNVTKSSIARIVVRPFGSPLPMGFFAFAAGTVLLSAVEMKWVPPSDAAMVSVILLSYVAPLELVASIFGFLSRDSGAATSMGILGTGWIAVALCFLLKGAHAQIPALGIFLLMEAAAMFVIGSVSLPAKPLLTVVLFLAGARFILSALVHLGAAKILTIPAAILGLIMGALAIYGALALLLEDIRQHSVLPVFRRGPAKESLEGGLQDQLKRLDHEAGVRQQL